MSKAIRILILAAVLVGLLAACALVVGRSRNGVTLAKYKAQLRAEGEKLSFADLGYPRPALTNDSLPQLLAAAEQLGQLNFQPGMLELMDMTVTSQATTCWSGANPRFISDASTGLASMSWAEFREIFQRAEPALADIRAGLANPPRYFEIASTNVFAWQRNPFVQKRAIAQWLSGDMVAALHEGELARAQTDLHALVQMVELHRDEPTLVNQMIRIAIAGLALADTWEALGAKGWTQQSLAALQQDWEGVDLMEAMELGICGERTLGDEAITMLRSVSGRQRLKLMQSTATRTAQDYLGEWVVMPLWRLNADGDELLFLQHQQACLESIRKLDHGVTWPVVDGELSNHYANLDKVMGNKLARIKHWFCAVGIANARRAGQTAVRVEMQRRLTVTAIALERHRLRYGRFPAELTALVPDSLSSLPIDLMDAKPLKYRLNTDGTFTLYSVGEDGRDDGGDASAPAATSRYGLWSGRDAVWPIVSGRQ